MAKRTLVLTGDKRLNRMLNALGSKKAGEVSRKALRAGAKLVLEQARGSVPVKSGAFRRSLTVKAIKRSRKRIGFRVTQKELNRAGTDKEKAFYGAFLELGYFATGRPAKKQGADSDLDPTDAFTPKEINTRNKTIRTYRRKTFKIRQLRKAKKMPARWIMRQAGKDAEDKAVELYRSEIETMIEEA